MEEDQGFQFELLDVSVVNERISEALVEGIDIANHIVNGLRVHTVPVVVKYQRSCPLTSSACRYTFEVAQLVSLAYLVKWGSSSVLAFGFWPCEPGLCIGVAECFGLMSFSAADSLLC